MNHNKNENQPDGSLESETTIAPRHLRGERTFNVGDVICGRYHLEEKLGAGAMGMVFRCRDENSGVEYAVKMVPPELARDEDAMESIRANFTLVHNLKHPGIAGADFLDKDLKTGDYYLIMEYVPGKNLSRWLAERRRDGGPDFAEVVRIAEAIAAALDYAHSQKITHRDIKPANIMITPEGQVKVLDFGLAAKVRSSMSNISMKIDNSSGTPSYMAPEQWKAQYPKPSVDQYALGVLTYEMLAGHLPFEAADNSILRDAVLNDVPEPVDGISERVMNAIRRAMAKKHEDRFANCMDFAAALTSNVRVPEQNSRKKSEKNSSEMREYPATPLWKLLQEPGTYKPEKKMLVFWMIPFILDTIIGSLALLLFLGGERPDSSIGCATNTEPTETILVCGIIGITIAAASYLCINWPRTRYSKLFWILSSFYIFLYGLGCKILYGIDYQLTTHMYTLLWGGITSGILLVLGVLYFCYGKRYIYHYTPWFWCAKIIDRNCECKGNAAPTMVFSSVIMLGVWTFITIGVWVPIAVRIIEGRMGDYAHFLGFIFPTWIVASIIMLIFFFKKLGQKSKWYAAVLFIFTMAVLIVLRVLPEMAPPVFH